MPMVKHAFYIYASLGLTIVLLSINVFWALIQWRRTRQEVLLKLCTSLDGP